MSKLIARGGSCRAVMAFACAVVIVVWASPAGAQPEVADSAGEKTAEPEIHVDLDGTVRVEWWLHPNLAFRLHDSAPRDWGLPELPGNLVEGTHTTAGLGVYEYRVGPVKIQVGGGVGFSTTTTVDGSTGFPSQTQAPTAVGTARVELELPRRWFLRVGVTSSGAESTVGVSVGTKF